jgi:hypothetical protein
MRLLILIMVLCTLVTCKTTDSGLSSGMNAAEQDEAVMAEKMIAALLEMHRDNDARVTMPADRNQNPSSDKVQKHIDVLDDVISTLDDDQTGGIYFSLIDQLLKKLPPELYRYAFALVEDDDDQRPVVVSSAQLVAKFISNVLSGNPKFDRTKFFEADVAKKALNDFLSMPKAGVSYDGVAGKHKYTDLDLQFAVSYLSSTLIFRSDALRSMISTASPQTLAIFTSSTNTTDASSRIEPSDLIINSLKHSIIAVADKNPGLITPAAGQLAEGIYRRFFLGETASSNLPFAILRNNLIDDEPVLLCASIDPVELRSIMDYSEERTSIEGPGIIKILPLETLWRQTRDRGNERARFEITCDRRDFEIKMKQFASAKIERPVLGLKGDVHAISSVDLINEMNPPMLVAGLGYLVANGFMPMKINQTSQLKSDFMAIANDGKLDRVILPVGHAFNSKSTGLGDNNGIKILAVKRVASRSIYLHIFLPPFSSSSQHQRIEFDDMKSILCAAGDCKGLEGQGGSVSVMTTSCHSTSTIDGWMAAYVASVSANNKNLPTPLIFASNEGYDTDNPFVIVSHLDHALRFVEGIASGKSPEEVKELMDEPLPYTFVRRIIEKAANLYSITSNKKVKLQNDYSPACNLDQDRYFQGNYKLVDADVIPKQ